MSNGRNCSSSHRLSRDSNQDPSNRTTGAQSDSTTGAQSEQSSSRTSSFGGGWGRPSNSRPQAYSGGGWGRPQNAQAAASGGWGRSSFQRSPPAVGGGWGRRPASEEVSMQQPQHTQQEEEHSCEVSAPEEAYNCEFVVYAFNKKYDLSQDQQSILHEVVQTYITSNPLRYGQPLKAAIDRALLKIHEELETQLRRTIPEKDSHPLALTMQEEFVQELIQTLSSYGHTSPEDVKQFVAEYMKMPLSKLVFSMTIDVHTGLPMCIKSSELFTIRHQTNAIHSYLLSLDIPRILQRFGFIDSMMPLSFFRKLPANMRRLIKFARDDDGRVVNGYVIVYPPHELFPKLYSELKELLIQDMLQSYDFHFFSLTSTGSAKTGDICLVIPGEINSRTKIDQSKGPKIMTMRTPTTQYRVSGPKGIYKGGGEKLNWQETSIPCSFFPKNMREPMSEFGNHLINHFGAVPFSLESDQMDSSENQHDEPEDTSQQFQFHSSAGGGWGAAAPK